MGMREEFEAWAANHYLLRECVTDLEDDEYFDPEMQYAWESWQASRAALVITLPYVSVIFDGADQDNYMVEACRDVIHAAGVRTK